MTPCFDVKGKTVVITGAAGQLGVSYADAFLQAGAQVAALDLSDDNSALGELAQQHPKQLQQYAADVTDKASLQAALQAIVAKQGVPDVLVNNAAIDSPPSAPPEENGPFEDYPEASWDRVLDVNLKGVFLSCQVFGASMAKAGRGAIINIASIYGTVSPDQSLYQYRRDRGEVFYKPVAYSASKSGIYNLTRYLATYWGNQGVRVNTLTLAGVFNHQDEVFLKAYCARIPIGRMAEPADYAGPMLFLASEASQYMTGADLVVDGGWTAI